MDEKMKEQLMRIDRKWALKELESAYRALERALSHIVVLSEAYKVQGHDQHGEYLNKVAELVYHVEQLLLDFRSFM